MHITCHLVPSLHNEDSNNDGMLLVRTGCGTYVDIYGVHLANRSYTRMLELGNRVIFLHSIYEDVEDYIY